MTNSCVLAPRYRLDDESLWLEGIDPSRNYWIAVNGDSSQVLPLPGFLAESIADLRNVVLEFRDLQVGQSMTYKRIASEYAIHCVGQNCYALAAEVNGTLVWHLFDQETLESLLMTAHPDWQCSPKDVDLGRRMLMMSWQKPVAA
ncbi:hypothetical protein Pse7367_3007 [Thalassoporum mexicanum PCC 7367]|uniref:hypothetical protein n=1 Tax=Thalassoporum mexicanum TaxID=3457544 RepID=UPI00029FEE18|nr:hypothetical protein [Pseudanabaena sp. PCC 7367]AFY71257.1 hypothetical protein Pse7367_3007 [Pseudanabaena sp. PCC 7367]